MRGCTSLGTRLGLVMTSLRDCESSTKATSPRVSPTGTTEYVRTCIPGSASLRCKLRRTPQHCRMTCQKAQSTVLACQLKRHRRVPDRACGVHMHTSAQCRR